jgi:hypothetical protein
MTPTQLSIRRARPLLGTLVEITLLERLLSPDA